LDDVMAGFEPRHVANGVAVRPLHAVHERPVVHVGVEVHDVQPLVVGTHHRISDGVVAADDDREDPGIQEPAHVMRDVVEGPADVRVDDVAVAAVHDAAVPPLVLEKPAVFVDVVVAELVLDRPVAGVLDGQLADLAGREARPWLPGRALVAGRPQDGDVGVDSIQVGAGGHAHERHEPREGQVQPVLGHGPRLLATKVP
jgi:hypothetical protein